MARYTRGTTTTKIYGRKYYVNSSDPVVAALVILHNVTANVQVAKTSTDKEGRWSFTLPNTSILSGTVFEVRFYGSGLIQKSAPEGDYELFETTGINPSQAIAMFYRGEYSSTKTYYYRSATSTTSGRRDVVRYTPPATPADKHYYLCSAPSGNTTGDFLTALAAGSWQLFEEEFSSVATDLLLAQDAVITRQLTVGSEDVNFGSIISPLISGLDFGNIYQGDGFLLANESGMNGYFRVGQVDGSSLVKGLSWDGPNAVFQVKASNFEVTPSGYMWADAGGFGGTSAAPRISLFETTLNSVATGGIRIIESSIDRTYVLGTSAYWSDPYTWSEGQRRITLVVTNPGFETGLSGWTFTPEAADQRSRDTSIYHYDATTTPPCVGAASLKLTADGSVVA